MCSHLFSVTLPDNGLWQCFEKVKIMFQSIRQPILERMQHLEKIDVLYREDGTRIFIQFLPGVKPDPRRKPLRINPGRFLYPRCVTRCVASQRVREPAVLQFGLLRDI